MLVEYDLNIFFKDLGRNAEGINEWEETYTIQPSVHYNLNGKTGYIYLDAFSTTEDETRSMWAFLSDPDAEDFWISLENFYDLAGDNIPPRIKSLLFSLPDIEDVIASKLS